MSEDRIEIVRRAQDAINRRDQEEFARYYTSDCEIVPLRAAMETPSYRGPDAAARFFSDSDEIWENPSIEEEEMQDTGDCVFATGILRGRGKDSGIDVEMRLGWVVRFRGDLIASRTYTDLGRARDDAGLSESVGRRLEARRHR